MTVSAPPRPPSQAPEARDSKPLEREEIEALVEALIEEARREQRRRRRRNAAFVTLVALVGVALLAVVGRSAQSQPASPLLSARSSLVAGATSPKIAFISEPPRVGYCGVVYLMNADGSGQRRLTNGGVPGCGQERSHAWSPDGRQIAFASRRDGNYEEIYVMNADGSGERELTPDNAREKSPAWSPDGRRIAFLSSGIRVVNADGSGLRRLTRKGWGHFGPPAWSPDGRRLAFVSRRDGNFEIYAMNADGSGQRRLTRNTVRDSNPVWSPDGRRIAFVSNWQVWVMNADGSGERRLTRNGARNFAPAWSPDGQRIAFERRVGRQKYKSTALEYGEVPEGVDGRVSSQVYVMNADGSKARKLADGSKARNLANNSAHPVWSPDGRKIAFAKQGDIYVMNADGSGQRNLTRTRRIESQPVWSPAQKP